MIPALVGKALLLGFTTGLFCVGFCVPLVGPLLIADETRGVRRSADRVLLFLAGRLVAYLLFGLVFGALGSVLTNVWSLKYILLPLLYAILGVMMVVYAVVQSFPHIGFCRTLGQPVRSGWYIVLVGFLAGINLCPPFLLAVTTVIDIGGALRGALFFLVFFLATSVYLLPLFFAGLVSRFSSVRFAGRVAAVLAGLYFLYLAASTALIRTR
ncbi:MAG TPA: sulfite exporter TauE/SafE family protein [bacterium]|nr:sulfite exporter TauE/SafE family protein [bacterium]